MKVRRIKPYVCVDCDYADHRRFQATEDIDAAAGTWLRCLAYSRAQQQDGLVKLAWLRRTFATSYGRVEELIKVGLLRVRDDGDYEIHAYAPRNQTRAMMDEERTATRERVREWRRSDRAKRDPVTEYTSVTAAAAAFDDRAATSPPTTAPAPVTGDSRVTTDDVTRYTSVTTDDVTEYEHVSNALVPTSTSTSSSLSSALTSSSPPSFSSSSDFVVADFSIGNVRAITRADAQAPTPAREERFPLPASERGVSGPYWLEAFREGIREQTRRPCTVARFYLETLERIVAHHAPRRDAPSACIWLKDQAKAFAAQWDGKHPAKGLTPDGLERWLNEGRQGPPVFGRLRIVQPPAEQWHQDDWSDLGAKVDE